MNKLPESYTRGSKSAGVFHHTLVKRTEEKAMYKVEIQLPNESERKLTAYEVFRVKVQKATDMVLGGVTVHYEEKEALPNDEAFGKWAWTYNTFDEANQCFEDMHIPVANVDGDGNKKRGRPKKVIDA